jgi:hypothetical protein
MKVRLFDICVLGNGIGGLVAALMLQKRKARIALISPKLAPDFDPQSCELLNAFSLKPMLKRIGFHPAEVNAIPALEAPLQLVFQDHRVDCYGDEQRFDRELAREFPAESKQISQLFKESYGHLEVYQHLLNSRVPLPPKGFFAKRQFRKVLEQVCDLNLLENRKLATELESFKVGSDFVRAVESMRFALLNLISPWTCGAQLAHLLTLVRWEGYLAPQGPMTIKKMLLDRLAERGAEIVPCEEIQEAKFSRGKITSFRLSKSEFGEVGCNVVIVAGDPRGLISIAPEEKRMRQWSNELASLPIYCRKAYRNYRLAPAGIPIGMKPQGIIVPPSPPQGQPERRAIVRALRYVVRQSPANGKAPEIHLGVTAFLPEKNIQEPEKLGSEIDRSLKRVIPFLDQHLLSEPKPPFIPQHSVQPGDFRQAFVYASEDPAELGVGAFTPETPLDNVFQAGDMVFPGLGLDGEIIAGLQATHYAEQLLRKEPTA